jgi:4-hydroxybenzoyl-CoA thioesterase
MRLTELFRYVSYLNSKSTKQNVIEPKLNMGITHNTRIHWGQCDPAGIVYFPRYLEIFDNCTELLFEAANGRTKLDMLDHFNAAGFPVVELKTTFKLPCRFGDKITIRSNVEKLGSASFIIGHQLFRSGELALAGRETRVWTAFEEGSKGKLSPANLPEELRESLLSLEKDREPHHPLSTVIIP